MRHVCIFCIGANVQQLLKNQPILADDGKHKLCFTLRDPQSSGRTTKFKGAVIGGTSRCEVWDAGAGYGYFGRCCQNENCCLPLKIPHDLICLRHDEI